MHECIEIYQEEGSLEALVLGLNETTGREYQASMETRGGGSYTPSYSYMVENRGRGGKKNKPPQPLEVKTQDTETQKAEGSKTNVDQGAHEEDYRGEKEEDKDQGSENRAKMGPCKAKTTTKPRVILNDPALLAHRDHMANYAIICKFM